MLTSEEPTLAPCLGLPNLAIWTLHAGSSRTPPRAHLSIPSPQCNSIPLRVCLVDVFTDRVLSDKPVVLGAGVQLSKTQWLDRHFGEGVLDSKE